MKVLAVFVAVVAVALAAPKPQSSLDKDAYVLRYDGENLGIDGYNYAFETSNGISAQENGEVTNLGAENQSISVRGQFTFVAPDGVSYTVSYIADDNGFQPQGSHIPSKV